jgi:hypothetical protein
MVNKEVILNEDELRLKLQEWQKILRLQDWNIEVGIHRAFSLDVGRMGEVKATPGNREAYITILAPEDYPPDSMLPQGKALVSLYRRGERGS